MMINISLIKRKNLAKESAMMDSSSAATLVEQVLSKYLGRRLPFNYTILYSFVMFFSQTQTQEAKI